MKRIIFVLMAIAMLLLVGCGEDVEVDMPEEVEEPEAVEEESLTEEVVEALTGYGGSEMTCEYTVPEGTAMFYFKNNKFRVEIDDTQRGEKVYYLNDGDNLYFWDPDDPQNSGIMWSLDFVEDIETTDYRTDIMNLDDATEREKYLGMYNADCTASAPNDKFSAPGNVEFMDMSEMMAQYQNMYPTG